MSVDLEIRAAAVAVVSSHEALKTLNSLLATAGRGEVVECQGMHELLSLIEQQLFSAADALAPATGVDPRQ